MALSTNQTTDTSARDSYKAFGDAFRMGATRDTDGSRILVIQAKQSNGTWKTILKLDLSGNLKVTGASGVTQDLSLNNVGELR